MFANAFHSTGSAGRPGPSGLLESCGFDPIDPSFRGWLKPHIYLVEPGGGSQGSYHHDGEETVYVIEGEVEFWLNEVERHTVRAGDCLTFPSTLAHRWQNCGTGRLTMLWVNTPITF
jgi:glyoxylate utilization-related uncharacterized protein